MVRMLVIAGLLAAAPTVPALASQAPPSAQATQCVETPAKKARKSMFGSLLGGVADSVLGRVGVPGSIAGVSLPVGSLLSDALLKLLDCKEQQQAAAATNQALRGGVGSEAKWQSASRANVRGVSKVTAAEQLADGSNCMTVTDVVIVDGEETVVPKKMCRSRGASGYAKV
ncbi:MAG: hypothetical protein H0U34_06800 [Sphingomonas sp.]|nr:hypothetical protein [Sphingomonas sp.]